MRETRKLWKFAVASLFAACTIALVGFLFFAAIATREGPAVTRPADGIVVLTGGVMRIAAAGRLLAAGKAKRLLVSGINEITPPKDVQRLVGVPRELFACCVDLGYAAKNTRGNADETRAWATRHRFKSLIVVTASYHMPRSLAELSQAMPGTELIAHPVLPTKFQKSPWWLDPSNASILAREYLKFVPSAARYALLRITQHGGGATDAAAKANRHDSES